MACHPRALSSATVLAADSAWKALTAIRAPSTARASAMARPMPRPAPVTRATRSLSFIDLLPQRSCGEALDEELLPGDVERGNRQDDQHQSGHDQGHVQV